VRNFIREMVERSIDRVEGDVDVDEPGTHAERC